MNEKFILFLVLSLTREVEAESGPIPGSRGHWWEPPLYTGSAVDPRANLPFSELSLFLPTPSPHKQLGILIDRRINGLMDTKL